MILRNTRASGIKNTPYDRIYYRDISGLLAYYDVRSLTDYYWAECPANRDLNRQHLKIIGNLAVHKSGSETKIYFVGHYRFGSDDMAYVHCLVYNSTSWRTVSPTYSAELYSHTPVRDQLKAYDYSPGIAVSPNGRTIAYLAQSRSISGISVVCCFYFDGSNYYYHQANDAELYKKNSLQFVDDDNMFYVDAAYGNVNRLTFQEAYCENSVIVEYENRGEKHRQNRSRIH